MSELAGLRCSSFALAQEAANDAGATVDGQGWAPVPGEGGSPKESGSEGHRAKYLLRLLRDPGSQLESSDLLYLLLSRVAPNETAERCGAALLQRFDSLGNLLAAPWARLEGVPSPIEDLAGLLKTVHAIAVGILRDATLGRPVISNSAKLNEYLKISLAHSTVEMVRILFLDGKNFLIKDELYSQGTIDQAPLYPREIVGRVIDLGAKGIILVHNHPTGDPTPSERDLTMTGRIADALRPIEVTLHDHVIVTSTRVTSFRKAGLL